MKAVIYTPTVTIFNENGTLDIQGNKAVIEYLIAGGVDGLVPLGSTGEFPALSLEEKMQLIDLYTQTAASRVDILPGTGCMDYAQTVQLSNYAIKAGAKGVLIIPPYYYAMSQGEAFSYYSRLAGDIQGDIYIYNFPARSGFDMEVGTVLALASKYKNIKGMKDSTTNLAHTKQVLQQVLPVRSDFEMYSGFDDHFVPNVMAGGAGCIAAISNILPALWKEWVVSVRREEMQKTREIGARFDLLMQLYDVQSNFALLFKTLMAKQGAAIQTHTQFPFDTLGQEALQKGERIVKDALK